MADQFDHDADCGCSEYQTLSRRQFISSASGAAAFAAFPDWLPKIVLAESYQSSRDVIVSIFQRGGSDGLTLCVPFAEPMYYSSRDSIAIPPPDSLSPNRGIALNNFFAFPQAMSGLMPAYTDGSLLLVHAAGSLNNSRSHFDAQRYMEVGRPADPTLITGWLGRHLASVPPMRSNAPLRALGIANGLQKTLVGAPKTLPIANPASFSIGGSGSTSVARRAVLRDDYTYESEPLHASALDALNTVDLLASLNINGYVPANGAVYPATGFGNALKRVAALIKADIGIEAAQIDIGGWDTHSAQNPLTDAPGSMFRTMRDFSNALAAFYADVQVGNSRVTVVSFSEFGRNVKENGTDGTDHGRGTVLFAMGQGINGGQVIANWPGLALEQQENRQDLRVTIDFRDILSEIVQYRLANNNLNFVFPGWTPTMRGATV